MTDAQIAAEYYRREVIANRLPRGVDHAALVIDVAAWARIQPSDVRRIVLGNTFTAPM